MNDGGDITIMLTRSIKGEIEAYKNVGIVTRTPWMYKFLPRLWRARYILKKSKG